MLLSMGLLSSCAQPAPNPNSNAGALEVQSETRPIIASVAASTLEVVQQLSDRFRKESGIELKINAGASNALAAQILAGAPADVFLSANREWADKLEKEGLVAAKSDLLSNRLVVVVPKGNPAGVHQPQDLASAAVKKLALAGENVPAGKYADRVLTKLGLLERLSNTKRIARGEDVRATLSFVERGEAEAGIVYATDARGVADVETAFELEPALYEKIVCVLVLVKRDPTNSAAQRYYDFLRGPQAAEAFRQAGFTPLASDDSAASSK
jgi:molybdate transport system substrate-binding protein